MFKDGEPFGQNAINPERSALTRRDFLKLAGTVSAGAAFSEVIAACSRREPGITPEPTSTPISPTPEEAEALQWFVAAEVLAGREAAFADASLNSRGRLEIIYERAVAALKANPETQAKNSEFDLFVIKAITADNREIGFPFITVKKTDPEGKNFVAMLVSTQNGVGKVISLVPYNATSISGEQYGMLALSRNPETEEKLFDADGKPISLWPIFSFPLGVTIEKWREMSAEEKQGQMVLFTPYGDASMGLQKDVPIHGLKVDALIKPALPETRSFSQVELHLEVAQKFIAGGEFVKPDQFEGRIFVDGQSGTTILFSQAAKAWLESQGLSVNPLSGPWMETLEPYLDPKGKGVARFGRLTLDQNSFVVLDAGGRAIVFADKDIPQGGKWRVPIIISPDGEAKMHAWSPNVGDGTEMHWHDEYGVVADDDYHVRVIYDLEKEKWVKVLPHERISGEYELASDAESRLRSQMDYMRSITGYGGNGVWEEAIDGNGIPYVKVHEASDPTSDVVYEVIVDKNGTPQMFTVRKTNNERGIVALDGSQAALMRQAWNLLERLDPDIYTKFWRVDKVAMVAKLVDDEKKYIYGTNILKDGKFGMILIRKFSNLVDEAEAIVGEGYELYAAQIGYNEKLFYIGGAPPDTRDSNAMVDAGLRYRDWVNKYGGSYGFEANRWLNYYVSAAGGYHPIKPKIPFEP